MRRETSGSPDESARPLRILMVLESNFTQRGGGGAESQLRTLSLYLKKLGHQVTIVTPMLAAGPQIAVERCYGIPVARLRYPRLRIVGGMAMCLRFFIFLWRRRKQYDAWHVHIGHHLGAITCLLGAIIGKPVVVKISGWWELEKGLLAPKASPLGRVARGWLMRANAVQAISTRIASELARCGFPADRVVVLPNAVDTARFEGGTGSRPPERPFTAVYVGRLVPEKDLSTLLDAWAAAFGGRSDAEVRLKLVGGGGSEPSLRVQAERLGIAGQIEFLGHRDRVEDVLAEAHVGVLPSLIEGLSNTLLEFMASSLPTLASRVSGSEDFVSPENGWLFPVSDAAALAACLREAEALPRERLRALGRQARSDVESKASLDHVVGSLLKLYRTARTPERIG